MYHFFFSAASMMQYQENSDLGALVSLLMWIGRCLVLAIFCGTGVVKVVKGQADERPEQKSEGFILIAAGGVLFAMTFAISGIFS